MDLKPVILIVDDTELNRNILREMLSDKYVVDEAANGMEAYKKLKEDGHLYSMMLLDNHMPEMTGIELLEKLEDAPWRSKLPVMMISSDRDDVFVNKAYELGVVDFIVSPFSAPIVKRRIQYVLKLYETHNNELENAMGIYSDKYYMVVNVDLVKDTFSVINASDKIDIWRAGFGSKVSDAVKKYVEGDNIFPDDVKEVKRFLDPVNIIRRIDAGCEHQYIRYRRKYADEYRWTLMEIRKAKDLKEGEIKVVFACHDIQEAVVSQKKEFAFLASGSSVVGNCNLSQNMIYHDEKSSYFERIGQRVDTVTEYVEYVVSKNPVPENRKKVREMLQPENLVREFYNGNRHISIDHVVKDENTGNLRLYRTNVQMYQDSHTKDVEAICYSEEISEVFARRRIEESLYDTEYYFIGLIDINRHNIFVHKSAVDDYSQNIQNSPANYEATIDRDASKYISVKARTEYLRNISIDTIEKKLRDSDTYEFTMEFCADDGTSMSMRYVYRYFDKRFGIVLCMIKNITEMEENDSVTGGINRRGFEGRARKILTNPLDDTEYSVLHFDVKEFKALNEILGYETANDILREVKNVLEKSSMHPLEVARSMADQFLCLVRTDVIDYNMLTDLCLIKFMDGDKPVIVRMHCGIFNIDDKKEPVISMCDKAKLAEKNIENEFVTPYAIYEPAMNEVYIKRMEVMNNVLDAIDNNEFAVYYQPIYNTFTKEVSTAEALIRWVHPKDGVISPGLFIPALEEKGTISQLDLYVARNVRRFLERRIVHGKKIVPVSMNLSRMDFFNTKMLNTLLDEVERSPLSHDVLRFEVTESAYININHLNVWFLSALKKMGNKVLLDDFGCGYSSLGTISEQNFDIIKMDMSFVKKIGTSKNAEAVICSIIDMAHRLGAKVIAEGVETTEQYEFLRLNKCDYIQGYYFSKPLTQEQFEELLK